MKAFYSKFSKSFKEGLKYFNLLKKSTVGDWLKRIHLKRKVFQNKILKIVLLKMIDELLNLCKSLFIFEIFDQHFNLYMLNVE